MIPTKVFPMDFASTLARINDWSVPDRIRLVQAVLDGLSCEPDAPDLTDDLTREIDRRLADLNANPDDVIPWEEVYRRTVSRLR